MKKEKVIVRGDLINKQLFAIMVRKIKSGTYPPRSRLPSEHEMARLFGVSHNTANKVIKQLESAGYVSIRRGIGAFINTLATGYDLKFIQSFRDWCVKHGHTPRTEVLVCRAAADADVAGFIFLLAGELVSPVEFLYLERLRYLDGKPAIFERRLLNKKKFGLSDCAVFGDSYMEFVRSVKRIKIHESQRKLRMVATPKAIAARLALSSGSKTIEITGRTTDKSGTVIDFDNLYYRPDYFEFVYTVGAEGTRSYAHSFKA